MIHGDPNFSMNRTKLEAALFERHGPKTARQHALAEGLSLWRCSGQEELLSGNNSPGVVWTWCAGAGILGIGT
jgi:hypothetical protein